MENTHPLSALLATARISRAVLFDARPTQAYETMQTPKGAIIVAETPRHLTSRNVHNSTASTKTSPAAVRTDLKSEVQSKSVHKKEAFSTQAALESVMNDASELQVHLSAEATKANPLLHALHDSRNPRNSNTSADGGRGAPILSASHPRVIENLTVFHNDSHDKRSQGKGIANLGKAMKLSATVPSIFQSDPVNDSLRGNIVADLCFTCRKDVRGPSTEARKALSPHGSSGRPGKEVLALDFKHLTTLLQNLHQQTGGKHREELNKEISHKNTGVNDRGSLIFNKTFLPLSHNRPVNPHAVVNSHILSHTELKKVVFDTSSHAEMSLVTEENTKEQSRPTFFHETFVTEKSGAATTTLYPSSKSFPTNGKPVKNGELFEKQLSIGTHQSKGISFTKSDKKASYGFTTLFESQYVSSSSPVPLFTVTPYSSQKSVTSRGTDHSTASHPTAKMNLIEARGAISPFWTVRADAFIPVSSIQIGSKVSSQTKKPISTLVPGSSAIKLLLRTANRPFADRQNSQKSTEEHRIIKQSIFDPSVTDNKQFMKQRLTSTFAIRTLFPVKFLNTEPRQNFGKDVSMWTQTALPLSSLFNKETYTPTIHRRTFDFSNNRFLTKTHQAFIRPNKNPFTGSQNVHGTNEPISAENQGVTETGDMQKFRNQESRRDDNFGNKREGVLKVPETESEKLKTIITSEAEIIQNIAGEAKDVEEDNARKRRDKDPGQGDDSRETDAERRGVTKIKIENSALEMAEKQYLERGQPGAENKKGWITEDTRSYKKAEKDMTNVFLEPTANSEEPKRDKGHTTANLSPLHSLTKDLAASKQNGIHQSRNAPQLEEITSMPFYHTVTTNHKPPRSALRSQRPNRSDAFPSGEPHTRIKLHLPSHKDNLQKHAASPPLHARDLQKEEVTFSATAAVFGVSSLKFTDPIKPTIPRHSDTTTSDPPVLHSISNKMSLTPHPLAITAGIQTAQPHFTVNSFLSLSIIHSRTDHRHKLISSVLRASSISHTENEREQEGYITTEMDPARQQPQMSNDSSAKPPTVAASSSQARFSTGTSQPHQGQSVAHRSQSSLCSDMISGQPCSFKLSAVDGNKQRFVKTLTPLMNPEAEIDQFPLSRMSPLPNLREVGGLTESPRETKTPQASVNSEYANSENDKVETFFGTTAVKNQTGDNESMKIIFVSTENYSDEVEVTPTPTTGRSKLHMSNTGEELKLTSVTKENDLDRLLDTVSNFVHAKSDIAMPEPSRTDQTDATLSITQESHPQESKVQLNSIDKERSSELKSKTEEKQLMQNMSSNTPSVSNVSNELIIQRKFTQQIPDPEVNATSPFQIIPVSFVPTARKGDSNKAKVNSRLLLATVSENVAITKKQSQAAVEHTMHSHNHTPSLSGTQPLIAATAEKVTPAAKRQSRTETQSVGRPQHQIFAQATEQSQHIQPAMTAASYPDNEADADSTAGSLRTVHRAGRAHAEASAASEIMNFSLLQDVRSAQILSTVDENKHGSLERIFANSTPDKRGDKKQPLPKKGNMNATTDSVRPVGVLPTDVINKTTDTTYTVSVTKQTKDMYKILNGMTKRNTIVMENCTSDCAVDENVTRQTNNIKLYYSPVTSKSTRDHTSVDETMSKKTTGTSDNNTRLERHRSPPWTQFVKRPTQRHFPTEIPATKATLSEPETTTVQTPIKSTERALLTENHSKKLLHRGAGGDGIFEAQSVSRSAKAQKKSPLAQSRSLVSELKQISPHLYLSGVTEVSDDSCGTGNYTAEMSLNVGKSVDPGDALPSQGSLKVVINLKTNNSQINLAVTSCCLSPTIQPDLSNSTCCLFSSDALSRGRRFPPRIYALLSPISEIAYLLGPC
ncbi:uncharacterized protein LOC112149638 isoform X2 [Oryzias melastigma]|uniref:uncharacterized protein LOC112149638 isoform X2 n=1 Tax=Oryzias melastigma TaxID=30732 RepID=UPI00168D555E|nr:uncharacterized protein LOC112149638 isoform X2 [Oryzias melastigma]